MGDAIHGVELSERLSRIETILEVISKSLDDSQPRIIYLEKELERQKEAHNASMDDASGKLETMREKREGLWP